MRGKQDAWLEEEVNHKITVGWMKLRSASRVLCDYRIPIVKGKFF